MKFPDTAESMPRAFPFSFHTANEQEQAGMDAILIARLMGDVSHARRLLWDTHDARATGIPYGQSDRKDVERVVCSVLLYLAGLQGRLLSQLGASLAAATTKNSEPVTSSEDWEHYAMVGWRLSQLAQAMDDRRTALDARADQGARSASRWVDPLVHALACRNATLIGLEEEFKRCGGVQVGEIAKPADLDLRLSIPADWATSCRLLDTADDLFAQRVPAKVWMLVVEAAAAAAPSTRTTSSAPATPTTDGGPGGSGSSSAREAVDIAPENVGRSLAELRRRGVLPKKARGRR